MKRLALLPLMAVAAIVAGLVFSTSAGRADDSRGADSPPAPENPLTSLGTMEYRPTVLVETPLRLAGSATLEQAAAFWAHGFMHVHPKAAVTIARTSTDAGWQALAEGTADVALLSRGITDKEIAAAAERLGRKPVIIAVGFDQLVWIVNEKNPVAALPWNPETGIMPDNAGRTPPPWSAWTDATELATVPVNVHGSEPGSGTRRYLERLVGGEAGWPGSIMSHDSITDVAEAVAADRGGLGLVGTAAAGRPGLRRVPLDIPPGVVGDVPGSERGPDFRPLYIAVAPPAEGDWPPALREFVSYVLSFPGQLDLAKDALVPLSRGEIHAQKERLGWPVER
jgi:ABC-type phosphate transport system substrate-binding protein